MKCFYESKCQLTSLFKYVEYLAWGQCVGFTEWPGSDVSLLCLQPPKYQEKHAYYYQIAWFIPKRRDDLMVTPPKMQNGTGLVCSEASGVITLCLDSCMSMFEYSF